MCWTYYTQTICKICRAIQPGVCALIEYCDPDCEKPCPGPWPGGKPEKTPKLGYVDSSQCSFCARITGPLFRKEKAWQEDFVRGELERMRTLFSDRAEEKRKRRERKLKRKKKVVRGESEGRENGGEEADTTRQGDSQEIDEQETDEQEADEQVDDERETAEQKGDGKRRTTRHRTRQRQKI